VTRFRLDVWRRPATFAEAMTSPAHRAIVVAHAATADEFAFKVANRPALDLLRSHLTNAFDVEVAGTWKPVVVLHDD